MVPVHDYENRYAAITKIWTFKHEPFLGGEGGGGGGRGLSSHVQ